jgi:peptidoglycan/LPS O-acetylase OafA/YrhL
MTRETNRLSWSIPKRLYLLDALRGIAALSVVLWHWYFFFLPFNREGMRFIDERQPYFDQLSFVYDHGGNAVNLFFCLSGFVFFWLYEKTITDGTTSFAEFSVLRFSRLYPLHFATLVLVALGQAVHISLTHTHFVHELNDPYHFLLNLAFAQAWGFQNDFSFNGPAWSVSIEILLYGIFFAVCRRRMTSSLMLFALSFGGGGVASAFNVALGSGLACFFVGGLAFRCYAGLVCKRYNEQALIIAMTLSCVAWFLTIYGASDGLKFMAGKYEWLPRLFPIYVLYPVTLLTVALAESRWGFGKMLSVLGDISYSLYLIHFPLQLAAVTILLEMKAEPNIFYSPIFFGCFLSLLILVSFASHKYFEIPAQRWIRSRFAEAPAIS